MVEEIYEIKNELLEQLRKEIGAKGIERIDKEMVDMVKDLAAAEKDCWEAEYYRSVTEAMEGGSGYEMGGMSGSGMSGNQMGYNGMSGAQGGSRGGNRGGSSRGGGSQGGSRGYRDSRGRYARRGYGMGYQEHIDALKMEMQQADPQQREQMMREIQGMM